MPSWERQLVESKYGDWGAALDGTIAVTNTYQLLSAAPAAGARRKRWWLENPSTASEVLTVAYGASFLSPRDIPIGALYEESEAVSQQAIYVKAVTVAHAFKAAEMR